MRRHRPKSDFAACSGFSISVSEGAAQLDGACAVARALIKHMSARGGGEIVFASVPEGSTEEIFGLADRLRSEPGADVVSLTLRFGSPTPEERASIATALALSGERVVPIRAAQGGAPTSPRCLLTSSASTVEE